MTEKNHERISEEIKEIVIMRIKAASSNIKLSIGNSGALTKEDMIKHVMSEDNIGKDIIRAHSSFLKAVANGEFTKAITSV